MIQNIGFIDASLFIGQYICKYKQYLENGVLELRGADDTDVFAPIVDRPILQEWKAARSLLARYRGHAKTILKNDFLDLGKAWIEMLPGGHGTPWMSFEDDYAQAHIRTRMCMVPAPDAYTYSGGFREILAVGVVNVVEHRILHSETNFSAYPRVHLVVDVERLRADQDV